MSRRRFASRIAVAAAALVLGVSGEARAKATGGEAEVKAAFVYNFLKFVEWPPASFRGAQGALVVGILGDGATADATVRFLAAKHVGRHPVVVRRVEWDQSLAGMHAIFVAESDADRLRRILTAAWAAGVLSIGEGADFAAGGGVIGLVVEERKVRFDVNLDTADAAGLKVSSKLLGLTRIIHSNRTIIRDRP